MSVFTQYNPVVPVVVVELGGPGMVEVCTDCKLDGGRILVVNLCVVAALFCEHEDGWLPLPVLLLTDFPYKYLYDATHCSGNIWKENDNHDSNGTF